MECPQCGHEQTCPCKACQARKPTDKPWVWVDGEFIACGNCGYQNHADWWEDQSYKQAQEAGGE